MKRAVWCAAMACAVAVSGCDRPYSENPNGREVRVPGLESLPASAGDVVATVNGRPLTGALLELYSVSRSRQHPLGKQPKPRELTDELINLELLAEEAERTGLDRKPDVAAELYFQRANLLASAMMEQRARTAGIGDAAVQQRYRKLYPDGKITEYRTRQILLNDRTTAQAMIRELRSGNSFAELAKSRSKGPAADRGGALDWFRPSAVLPEFAAAVAGLKIGEFTKVPVHTTYGWHVILLEDKRTVAAPALEQAAPDIVRELITERLDKHLDELRAQAKIEVKRP